MNKILLFAIILAVAIIGGAIVVARHGQQGEEAPAGPSAQFNGEQLTLDEGFQTCGTGEQCIVVDTHCGFCCKYTAINSHREQDFNKAFDKNCSHFKGQSCNCFDLSSYPSCVEGKCQLVSWGDNKQRPATPPPPVQQSQPEPAPAPVAVTPQEEIPVSPDPIAAEPITPQEEPAPVQAPTQPVTPQPGFGEPAEEQPESDGDLYAPLPKTFPSNDNRPRNDNPLDKPLPSGNIQ